MKRVYTYEIKIQTFRQLRDNEKTNLHDEFAEVIVSCLDDRTEKDYTINLIEYRETRE